MLDSSNVIYVCTNEMELQSVSDGWEPQKKRVGKPYYGLLARGLLIF